MATATRNNRVTGKVTDPNMRPVPDVKVEIYNLDMRNWQLLAGTVTDREGKYELEWSHSQLSGREKKTADIGVRVVTIYRDTELFKSTLEQVRFNAGEREEINITLSQAAPVEKIEFDTLLKDVQFLAGEVRIEELQESKEHRDVTFLSKELEVPAEKIEHLIVAHKLQKKSDVEAAFFYALLRKDVLLHEDLARSFKARHSIGIDSDEKTLLYDIALLEQSKVIKGVEAAVAENIVGRELLKDMEYNIGKLLRFKEEGKHYYEKEHPRKVIELLTTMLNPLKILEIQDIARKNKNDINAIIEKVADPKFLEEKKPDFTTNIDRGLNKLFDFTKTAIPNIVKENKIKKSADIKKLARFNKKQWVEQIKKTNPKDTDEAEIDIYASTIVRKFENAFPTAAFVAQLERESKTVIVNQKELVSFFNKHDDFDMLNNNVDLFIKKKKIDPGEAGVISNELKSVQRIFKLIPHYGKTMALRKQNVNSAYNIVTIGEKRFVSEVAPKAGISEEQAKKIYMDAEAKNTAAMLMIGDLSDTMMAQPVASLGNLSLAKKIEAVSKDFPNLKSLFKIADACECEHCRSVYSPAAYLVEILQFLDKRTVKAGNAKTELFKRRPDLGEIDLGCENANTPLKYIDLVCEILEEAVAPDAGIIYAGNLTSGADPSKGKIAPSLLTALTAAGLPVTDKAIIYETETSMGSPLTLPHYLRDSKLVCKIENTGGNNYKIFRLKQTMSSAAELDAAPEYVNTQAYDKLRNKKFAFKLPFDLPHTEARAYFERFNIPRSQLMKKFQLAADPSDAAIATEYLGLTDGERQMIANTPLLNDNAAQQEFWNVPAPGNVIDHLKKVDHFLDRTGMSYKELELLLKLRFINKGVNLFIFNDDLSCDTAKKEIKNLDLVVLDRIHRFLRIQKKTGWKFETLDEVISQARLGNGNLNDACLKVIADIKKLGDATGLKIEDLICCYGEIPHIILPFKITTLYNSIFQNKAKNGTTEPGLAVEKIIENEAAAIKKPLTDFQTSISVCVGIKESDFLKLTPPAPNNELSFANLSALFAKARLIKKLKLKPDDYLLLQELSGIDPLASCAKTLEFMDSATASANSPLKLVDIKFMLKHEADNLADREINLTKIQGLIKELQAAYQKAFNENKSSYKATMDVAELREILKAQLSVLPVLNEEDTNVILNFLDKNWKYTWIDSNYLPHIGTTSVHAKTFIDDKKLANLFDVTVIKTEIDNLNAAPGPNIEAEQKALIKAWMDAMAVYRYKAAKQANLFSSVSVAFKTDIAAVEVILKSSALKKMAPGTELLIDLLVTDSIIDTADITLIHPLPQLPVITEAAFAKQYAAVRLLHKLFPFITAFKFDNTQVQWFLENAKALAWFQFDEIPFAPAQPAAAYQTYVSFLDLTAMIKELVPVINPADAENPTSFYSIIKQVITPATTKTELMQSIALLTGDEKADLEEIDSYWFAAFNLNNYKSISTWKQMLDCAEMMRTLSAKVAQVTNYIKPVLNAGEVADLRSNLKTRYDEDTWLSTLKEIMDKIRPQKRNALVTYLLATNDGIKDENDLYEYFLVDVEMGSCMPSSRIVLAHNSIQLFTQRCLMGLELDAIADTEMDPNWSQFQWMKNYRVWEANRKIFLYPENWYDVTLADDKSFLLSEFINELQQNELTNDTAEASIRNYLEKLDKLAFLEVKATWYDVPTRTMHVFARTKGGDPSIYYYRRFEKERSWTAWEKVELDISGNQLVAFMRNNRLNLAWLMYTEEAKPDQKSRVPAGSDQGTEIDPDRPKKKLIIQLAISEYSNNRWQPKLVSSDSISTPDDYTPDYSLLNQNKYSLLYVQASDQVYIMSSVYDGEDINTRHGIFDLTGCKGYPEKVNISTSKMLDFLPDFDGAELRSQRYIEKTALAPNDLKLKEGMHPFSYYELLAATPGQYRISYPHQLTTMDLLSMLYQFFVIALTQGSNKRYLKENDWRFKIPVGTLLPYFMEDSWHSYVIIPGFYTEETTGEIMTVTGEIMTVIELNDDEKRTVSDIFKLLDDIKNWMKRMLAEFVATPPANVSEVIARVIADAGFQEIIQDMSRYKFLQPFLQLIVGNTGDAEFDEQLRLALEKEGLVYGNQFKNMYHPLICYLRTQLYKDGVKGLMKRDTQLYVNTKFNFKDHYAPHLQHIAKLGYKQPDGTLIHDFPIEDIDFTSDGSYSLYNWDLFYRVPLHIAGSLTRNQRFEEALTWFHYMFNPTGALPGTGVQKYWVTKPFYLNQESDYLAQRIDNLMYAVSDKGNPAIKELEFAIDQWRTKPFRPDVIARFRPVAYQKALLMKYIDNLMEWGDYLFRQNTMESRAMATQMYVMADKLLGPKQRVVAPLVKPPYETYNQIEAKLDSFGNALIELENILPDLSILPQGGAELPPAPVTLSMLYFCIPQNEKMIEYWDRVADRLLKLRHCQDIDGIESIPALFAPPIDPAALVRAAASGMSISSILAGLNAPTPYYRFNVLAGKATELAMEVRGLGSSLLQALEKKDAEAMSLLRSELEIKVLNAVKDMKKLQISEAKEQIEILKRTQKVTEERAKYYENIEKIIPKEQLNLDKLSEANDYQTAAQIVRTVAGALRLIPEFHVGAAGFGGSPEVVMQLGGSAISGATNIAADILNVLGSIATYEAGRASTLGGYDRRFDDWKLQERLAKKELLSIDKQIKAAEIRKEISETDLKNHMLSIENAKKTDEFMRSKFTNKELYDWMIGQVTAVYFKSYKLAHDTAMKAERCYRFELGNGDSFISYGYWESLKKGLQSADQLVHDIKRMETSYFDKNKREYEITKHVSLAQLDPLALIRLRTQGVCDFTVPEALYDMDYAGQYFRRIKSVSISLPCIAGPFTSVSARLSLVNNKYRKNTASDNAAGTGYPEDPGNDDRFVYNVGSIQSIATSAAQNDSGVFELNFRDERYVPFEGTGAISSWRLELPTPNIRQFNYDTIADVVLHIKYTAREGGSSLKGLAETELITQLENIKQQVTAEKGMHLVIDMKHEMPNEWHMLKKTKSTKITLSRSRLPYFIAAIPAADINHIKFISKSPAGVTIKVDGSSVLVNGSLWGLFEKNHVGPTLDNEFTLSIVSQAELDSVEEMMMVVKVDLL